LLVLVSGSCFGHSFYYLQAGPMPLTADRLLLVVLIVQYAIFRRRGLADPKPLNKTDLVLGAFLGVLLLSALAHDWHYSAMLPLSRLLFFYLMPVALYWIARQSAASERALVWMFGTLAAFGLYLCITAVAEEHQAWSWVFPRYIASSTYGEFFGRGRGPFLNPAGLGVFQGACLCAALTFWPRLQRPGKTILLLLLPIYAWGIYSTLTRSVWMGVALEVFVVGCLCVPRAWRPAVIGVAVLSSVAVVTIGWSHLVAFKRDRYVTVEEMEESANLRPIFATVAWHMFLDRPLLGCGFGQYFPESRPYLSDRSTDLPLEKARPYVQHNVFLALLTETGLLGTGLFVALLALWARNAWRLWRWDEAPLAMRQCGLLFLALLAVYLSNAMFHDLAIIPMVNMLLFFVAGVATGLAPAARLSGKQTQARIEHFLPRTVGSTG